MLLPAMFTERRGAFFSDEPRAEEYGADPAKETAMCTVRYSHDDNDPMWADGVGTLAFITICSWEEDPTEAEGHPGNPDPDHLPESCCCCMDTCVAAPEDHPRCNEL